MGRTHRALSGEMLNRPHFKRIRNIWYSMKERVLNPAHISYPRYGARGVTVCERWMDLENFYADVVDGCAPGLSLDRIDNAGDYCPENVKWSTRKEQANNRRSSRLFTINGETKTLAQWIDTAPVKSSLVRQRFYVLGWPIEQALEIRKGV